MATETLQHSVPDRFGAFSLGLTDSVMVTAAMVGALVGPHLVTLVGALPAFGALGLLLVVAAVQPPPLPGVGRQAAERLSRSRVG